MGLDLAATAKNRLGIGMYSYGIAWNAARNQHPKAPFSDAISFLEYAHGLGAGGVQVAIGGKDAQYAAKLRAKSEAWQMYVEGQTNLPKDESEIERFETELRTAKTCGAQVIRTAMLGSRRYETFDSAEAFREFAARSWRSLVLAEPLLKKHGIRLAIENHKDWRIGEMLDLLRRISSEYVGVCVDTGNSIALLEEPMAVIEAYAPWAFTTHFKDMAVEEHGDGFLLSEVPLGEGFLDLKKIVEVLQRAAPKTRLNLEMITRDPLRIPCLTDKYWATMQSVLARELADALGMVRGKKAKEPLPRVGTVSLEEKLKIEDQNVRRCVAYAQKELGV